MSNQSQSTVINKFKHFSQANSHLWRRDSNSEKRYHQQLFLLSLEPILKAPQITESPHWHFWHKQQTVQYLWRVLPSATNKYVIKSSHFGWSWHFIFHTKPWRWPTTVFSKRLVVLQSCFLGRVKKNIPTAFITHTSTDSPPMNEFDFFAKGQTMHEFMFYLIYITNQIFSSTIP